MAHSLKATVLGVTLLGVWWALPPRSLSYPEDARGAAVRELNRLATEISRTREAVERPLIAEVTKGDIGVTVASIRSGGPKRFRPIESAAWQALTQVSHEYGIDGAGSELVLVFAPQRLIEGEEDLPVGPPRRGWSSWTTAGAAGQAPACVTRIATDNFTAFEEQLDQRGFPTVLDRLGPCLLPYWFGAPGKQIGAWYAGVGRGFARQLPRGRPPSYYGPASRRSFGKRQSWGLGFSPQGEACLAGRPRACEGAFIGALPQRLDPGHEGLAAAGRTPFGGHDRSLLFAVLSQFGADRFRVFWESEEQLAAAFESAFDVPLDEWIYEWASEVIGTAVTSPSVPVFDAAGAILLIGAFGGLGTAIARRRRVL